MNIVPNNTFTIDSLRAKDEVIDRLRESTDSGPMPLFPKYDDDRKFHGEVSGDEFKLVPLVYGNYAFRPVIEGKITSAGGKTIIDAKMRPANFSVIFIFVWIAVSLVLLIQPTISCFNGEAFDFVMLLPLVFSLALHIFMHVLYKVMLNSIKERMYSIL